MSCIILVMSHAQDSRDSPGDDTSDYSLDPCDYSDSDDDSPPPSPPSSPPPPPPATRRLSPKPLPPIPASSKLPPTPSKPLPAAPTNSNAKPRKEHKPKPLPPLPPQRPTVVSTPAPSPTSAHASTPATTAKLASPAVPRKAQDYDAYFPGVCAACGGRIPKSGQLLLAGNAQYHPACFACSVCASPITGTYQEYEGAVFCARHPVATHARRLRCAVCNGTIKPGNYLLVGGEKYHMECFTCKLCGLQFGTQHNYYDLWGGHICLPCYDATWKLKNRSRIYKKQK